MRQERTESLERVVDFLRERWNCAEDDLGPQTRISEDLRIFGDDADELMHESFARFQVDGAAFDFDESFHSEWELSCAVMPMVLLWRRLTPWISRPERVEPRDLTVAEMSRAMDRGAW